MVTAQLEDLMAAATYLKQIIEWHRSGELRTVHLEKFEEIEALIKEAEDVLTRIVFAKKPSSEKPKPTKHKFVSDRGGRNCIKCRKPRDDERHKIG